MATTDAAVHDKGLVIPLIDFSRFLDGSPAEKETTAKAILHGFQSAGFIYLSNHPIPDDVLSRTFSRSAAFFRLPEADKLAVSWTTPEANRGYTFLGREKTTQQMDPDQVAAERAAVPDLKETYEMGLEPHPSLHNRWPAEEGDLEGFRADMMDFYHRCQLIHHQVMVAIAIAMGLGPNFFDGFFDACDHQLRLLHYPEVKADVFRAKPGQDYGSVTLLFQDDRGGLQVKSPTGNYVDATPIPGTIVVNAGDLLARWSNDTIKSTLHRVVEPPRREGDEYPPRYSIAFFGNPNFSTTIETLPGTFLKEEDKKYKGVNSGEYITGRLAVTRRRRYGLGSGLRRMVTVFPLRDAAWLSVVLLTFASSALIVAAFFRLLPLVAPWTTFPEELTIGAPVATFVGGVSFLLGGTLATLASFNIERGRPYYPDDGAATKVRRGRALLFSREWVWFPPWSEMRTVYLPNAAFQAGIVSTLGGYALAISAIAGFPGVLDERSATYPDKVRGLVLIPLMVGGSLLLVGGLALTAAAEQERWYLPRPSSAAWQGSFWFAVAPGWLVASAALSFAAPGEMVLSSAFLLVAAVLFWVGASVQWFVVMEDYPDTAKTFFLQGSESVYPAIGDWTRWTQTLAALEVSSRYLLTWAIVHRYPSVSSSPAYSTMLLAWSFSEVVRYSYFVVMLSSRDASSPPAFITRLRYNTFWVFYPMGIISECVLVYKATALCSQAERLALYAVLAIYVPGSYLLYSHMIAQRRKVMRSLKAKDEKATR
ncbi:hypothetical protein CP532_3857 [Ophiocordyceps camponoti-leonardi (nom. inval.)]|nr:hypothetical protein CP532_3857 [Ophiocordyceps camponoti-leonardi (nom. inval.)]